MSIRRCRTCHKLFGDVGEEVTQAELVAAELSDNIVSDYCSLTCLPKDMRGLYIIAGPKYRTGSILCMYRNYDVRGTVIRVERCGQSWLYHFKENVSMPMFPDANALPEFQVCPPEELVAEKLMGRAGGYVESIGRAQRILCGPRHKVMQRKRKAVVK
jgi:hypothetical protein